MFKKLRILGIMLFVCSGQAAVAAPAVTLTAPVANSKYTPPASITLTASASDAVDTITSVEFYSGGTLLGTSTTAPFSYTWSNVPAGNHSLTARAINSQNVSTTSSAVPVTVNTTPTVALTAPVNGASYTGLATISLSANAADTDGNLSKVEFLRNGILIGTVTAAPYSYTWSNVQPGSYSITARATDSLGSVATSGAVSVNVTNPITVTLTAPANNSKFTPPVNITLTADASDSNGTITRVDFYNGGTVVGTATSAPYTVSWNNVATGKYYVSARATDSQGLFRDTQGVTTVIVGTPPVVSVSAPAANSSYVAPAAITLSATASDSDGTISWVQFYNGSTWLATVTAAPYTYQWNNVAAGNHSITAVAADNLGVTTTSAPVVVQVTPNVAPTVSLTAPVEGQKFVAPSNILLNASATDSGGSISKVEFYRGATLLGTLTNAPYSYLWANVTAGNYAVTAKATDNGGLTTTTAPVNISVVNNARPVVGLTATPSNAVAPATISLSASASDSDGSISRVEFFNGATLIAAVSQPPYTYNWNVLGAGNYSITAWAVDDQGSTTTSAPVNVTVTGNGTEVYYIHPDHLNTPRAVTDQNNQVVWQWENLDPFGTNPPNENPSGLGNFAFNLRFPGQYFDKETNLHYNYFRDYDPATGRYIQSDPIGLKGGINTYAYVGGNPLSFIDPYGLETLPGPMKKPSIFGLACKAVTEIFTPLVEHQAQQAKDSYDRNQKAIDRSFEQKKYNCSLVSDLCKFQECMQDANKWWKEQSRANWDAHYSRGKGKVEYGIESANETCELF